MLKKENPQVFTLIRSCEIIIGIVRIRKKTVEKRSFLFSCGDPTRTNDLWVMSPTSYQLLHSAMFNGCKGTALFGIHKLFAEYFYNKFSVFSYVAENELSNVRTFFSTY